MRSHRFVPAVQALEGRVVLTDNFTPAVDLEGWLAQQVAMTLQQTTPLAPPLTTTYEQLQQMVRLGMIEPVNVGTTAPTTWTDSMVNAISDLYDRVSGAHTPLTRDAYIRWWTSWLVEITSANRPILIP